MQHCLLPGTGLSVSRFVFGTASLFSAGRERERARLLDAAVDAGFTHFDTAPYYGFGTAERDLGALAKRHRHVTITTKVGLYSAGGEGQGYWQVLARKALGKAVPSLARPTVSFDLPRAREALSASLRRLGRNHVELYLLHEPVFDRIDAVAWVDWLDREQSAGRIGRYGLAADADRLRPFLPTDGKLLRFVQTIDSLAGREADALVATGRPLQLTYGYVSAARTAGDDRPIATILSEALARNRNGAVIVSTRKADRVAQYPRILESAPA